MRYLLLHLCLALLLYFCLAFLYARPAFPAIYHVAQHGGSDRNTCPQAQDASSAKASIAAGATCLTSGDALLVHGGLYRETLQNVFPAQTSIAGAGDAFNGTGELAEIRPPNTPNGPIIKITNNNVTLHNLVIDGRDQQTWMYLIQIEDPVQHTTIQNSDIRNSPDTCDAWGSGGAGITTGHNTSGTVIRHNHIHHISTYGGKKDCSGQRESAQTIHGYYGTGSNELIEDNSIHDNAGWGIHYYATAVPINGTVVRRNRIYNNDTGLQIGSGDGSMAYNNLLYGHRRGIIIGRYGITATNQQVYNNTISNSREHCIINAAQSSKIRNNICWQTGLLNGIKDEGSNTVQSDNLFTGNPRFVDPDNGDYHVQPNSPALDAGMSMGSMFTDDMDKTDRGQPFGMGAYGRGTAPPQPIPPTIPHLHWQFHQGSGVLVPDLTGNANTGQIQNASPGVWYPPAPGSYALRLDGTSVYVSQLNFTWQPHQPVTVIFWIWTAGGTPAGLFGFKGDNQNRFGAHAPWSDNWLYWDYGLCCGEKSSRVKVNFTPYLKKWTHVALVSNTTDFTGIYLNGQLVASHNHPGSPSVPLTGLELGRWQVNPVAYSTALVDNFHLENKAWSAEDILAEYRNSVELSRHSLAGLP